MIRDRSLDMNQAPLLTVMNFSGGKQSSAILWMVLLGTIPRPDNLIVLNADPGMENHLTYKYVDRMFEECHQAGIPCKTVDGPNLYQDLLNLKSSGKTRIDNPPYWTKNENGSRGRLKQCCTKYYKISPMDREIRRILEQKHGISRKSGHLPAECVEKWVGFSSDEMCRIKPSDQRYVRFRYPLIELGLTNADVLKFFTDHDLPFPPRSVCNACFANRTEDYKEMFENRPNDWAQAVKVDEAVRDWKQVGVEQPVYVSSSLVPLKDLPKTDFDERKFDLIGCHAACQSGYCFN